MYFYFHETQHDAQVIIELFGCLPQLNQQFPEYGVGSYSIQTEYCLKNTLQSVDSGFTIVLFNLQLSYRWVAYASTLYYVLLLYSATEHR